MKTILTILLSIIGIFSTGILIMPARAMLMIAVLICCAAASAVLIMFRKRLLIPAASGRDRLRAAFRSYRYQAADEILLSYLAAFKPRHRCGNCHARC